MLVSSRHGPCGHAATSARDSKETVRPSRIKAPVDAPLEAHDALIRPWRTATLVASLVAAIELVLLLAAVFLLVAKPLSHAMQRHAEATAFAPVKQPRPVIPKQAPIGLPKLLR